jgi:hypothetical protein
VYSVFLSYVDALNNFDHGSRQVSGPEATANIWATYPQTYVSVSNAFADQVYVFANKLYYAYTLCGKEADELYVFLKRLMMYMCNMYFGSD